MTGRLTVILPSLLPGFVQPLHLFSFGLVLAFRGVLVFVSTYATFPVELVGNSCSRKLALDLIWQVIFLFDRKCQE